MKHLKLFTASLIALSLCACKNETVSEPSVSGGTGSPNKIILKSSVTESRTPNTDLQKNQIANGVKIGAFIVKEDGSCKYENEQLSADGNGKLTGNDMYFPIDGSVSIHTYAPYNGSWTYGENTFTISNDQSFDSGYLYSDLLYGEPQGSNSFSNSTGAITVNHLHKLAKLTIDFNVVDDTDLTGATINVLNTLPSISLNATDGTLGTPSGTAAPIKAHVVNSTEGEAASVIIVPQTLTSQTPLVEIVTSEASKTLQAKLTDNVTFESGKAYTYTVKVSADVAEITLTTTVTDWETGDELTGEAAEVN